MQEARLLTRCLASKMLIHTLDAAHSKMSQPTWRCVYLNNEVLPPSRNSRRTICFCENLLLLFPTNIPLPPHHLLPCLPPSLAPRRVSPATPAPRCRSSSSAAPSPPAPAILTSTVPSSLRPSTTRSRAAAPDRPPPPKTRRRERRRRSGSMAAGLFTGSMAEGRLPPRAARRASPRMR